MYNRLLQTQIQIISQTRFSTITGVQFANRSITHVIVVYYSHHSDHNWNKADPNRNSPKNLA